MRERTKFMNSVVTSYISSLYLLAAANQQWNSKFLNYTTFKYSNSQRQQRRPPRQSQNTILCMWNIVCRSRIVCENRWVWKTHGGTPKRTTIKRFWHFWIISLGTNAKFRVKKTIIMKKKHRKTAKKKKNMIHELVNSDYKLNAYTLRETNTTTEWNE